MIGYIIALLQEVEDVEIEEEEEEEEEEDEQEGMKKESSLASSLKLSEALFQLSIMFRPIKT
jgi:hypothetical protein